ncbi:MAG: ATP-binding cassette domain-containing protein [Candidatus Delongbacteria bacterium]|jgi:cell division transport system ATP-binding protein|nr:ATP-binding cassette domain-containing protein [Candidatus Delongbacteria bacterium]
MEVHDNSPKNIVRLVHAEIKQGDNTILTDVNLEIKNGDFYYLIGKVGSGKTSLLKALYADIPVEAGESQVAGFDLLKFKNSQIPQLRRKLGIVFQDFQLLIDRTVYKNLLFVLKATGWNNKRDMNRKIDTVLAKVDMVDKKDKMPLSLSGGEQQRVVIARALLNDPEIIFADEPTGNLDPESGGQIIDILRKIRDTGRAVLMVTHNYSLIKDYQEPTLVIEDGKVSGEGTEISQINFGKFSDGSEDLKLFE